MSPIDQSFNRPFPASEPFLSLRGRSIRKDSWTQCTVFDWFNEILWGWWLVEAFYCITTFKPCKYFCLLGWREERRVPNLVLLHHCVPDLRLLYLHTSGVPFKILSASHREEKERFRNSTRSASIRQRQEISKIKWRDVSHFKAKAKIGQLQGHPT